MVQKDFNTIIGQIEEDLKKLQSAKEQVEKVVAENTAFSKATSALIDNTKSLLSDVKNLTEDSLTTFTEQLAQTKVELDRLTSQTQQSVTSSVSNFDSTTISLTKTFSNKAEEVTKTAKNTLEEQKSENLKMLNLIIETHNNIKQLIGQLFDLKIPETLVNINENLSGLRKEIVDIEINNQKRFKTSKILHISTLTIVSIFGIVIILKIFGII